MIIADILKSDVTCNKTMWAADLKRQRKQLAHLVRLQKAYKQALKHKLYIH